MNSQMLFTLDKKLKEQAMKKARAEGIPFGSILKMATRAYVDGKLDVGVFPHEQLNAKTRKEIERALQDIKAGKNTSRSFTNVNDMMAYLNKK